MSRVAPCVGLIAVFAVLAACSNGRGSLDQPPASQSTDPPPTEPAPVPPPTAPAQENFTIGGTVSGLIGSGLVLQNNAAGDLTITTDGTFTFTDTAASGAAYDVKVATQPNSPAQVCTVANGTGTVATANVSNIFVSCSAAPRFSITATVSGVLGPGLVLQNNGTDDLPIGADGTYTFPTSLTNASSYNVTVKNAPVRQNCAVTNASGTIAAANVANVQVVCVVDQFTVGGTVSGLAGSGLTIRLNGGNERRIDANGAFAFPTTLANGTAYAVEVASQPVGLSQDCSIANATGSIAGANIENVAITCVTKSFPVGGAVSGLAGSGLVLTLNGTTDLAIMANGTYRFPEPLLSGTSYQVRVKSNPSNPVQVCTISNADGAVTARDVSHVNISCATQTFSVGGTVGGLLGSGLTLLNNGGDQIAVTADGTFTFPTRLASGSGYSVSVGTHPSNPTQACSVREGTGAGTLNSENITTVQVSCSTSNFTVGGTVRGLAGNGLTLRNGTDTVVVTGTEFTFPTAIPSGSTFNVEVDQNPTGVSQTCSVAAGTGTGTVTNAPVTSVVVDCVTNGYTVGGQVTGLIGQGLVIQNNGVDDLAIAANSGFTFPTALPSGTPYTVTVLAQPQLPTQVCSVVEGVGTVVDANIANIEIRCVLAIPPLPFP